MPPEPQDLEAEREQMITAVMEKTGKSREQVLAFIDLMKSGFARRGTWPGEPLSQNEVGERLDTFMGPTEEADDRDCGCRGVAVCQECTSTDDYEPVAGGGCDAV